MKIFLRHSFLMTFIILATGLKSTAATNHSYWMKLEGTQLSTSNGKHEVKQKERSNKGLGWKKFRIWKQIFKWSDRLSFAMPTGKLLTSIILLLLSIVLLAVGGATKYGLIFGILGSVAIIGAVIALLLWLAERSKTVQNRD